MRIIIATLALLSLSACLTLPTTPAPDVVARRDSVVRATEPVCEGEADCRAKWEAAQLWVLKHAGYKIQTATSVIIQTFNPRQYSQDWAVTVTKEPKGSGRYAIRANVWCANTYGCIPDRHAGMIDFNRVVSEARP